MKHILLIAISFLTFASSAQGVGLFFSEYAEGSSNNKYLEIYNGTGAPVDLGNFSLSSCSNGCNTFGEFDFPDNVTFAAGTIVAAGDVYIIAHPSADPTILAVADQTFTFLSNGDDVFALTIAGATASNYEILDIIGDMQGDPGSGWDVAGTTNGTVNHTLVRNPNICVGNPTPLGSFGTDPASSEWIVGAQDDWTAIDVHFTTCTDCSTTFGSLVDEGCDAYTSPSGNYTWTASGQYRDTIPSLISATCDSVIFADITINQSYTGITDSETICDGTSFTFGTQTLTVAGDYTETFTSSTGCDSTVTLTLSTVTSYTTNLTESICNGEEFILGTQILTTTGNYSELFTSSLGCDSTVNVDLTVLPNSANTISPAACGSYTVPSGDETYTMSGMYMDTIPSANGCDSVLTINLTINDTNLVVFTEAACDSYDFEGNTYTTSGTYDVMFTNQFLCDSTRRLVLTITNTPNAPTLTADQNLCIGDTPTDIEATVQGGSDLIITGVLDGPLPGGFPKCVEFYAINPISDLSIYGFGSANNGGGSDGEEFTFPAVSLNAGEYYRVGTDSTEFNNFFGFFPNEVDQWAGNVNGDDAIELFQNSAVVDVFGDINVDGSGEPWEYLDGWAYRNNGLTPNGGTFDPNNWSYSGPNALDNETSNATAVTPFPVGSFTTPSAVPTIDWFDDAGLTNNINTGSTYTPSTTVGVQNFYVVATVNGCASASAQSIVTINDLPSVDAGMAQTVCENDQVTLSGSGAATYTWDNGVDDGVAFIATATQTYTVTGEDANGCSNTDQVTVTVNPLPTVSYTDVSTICSYYDPITLAAGNPAGGTYSGSGVSGTTFDPSAAGVGTATVTYSYTDMNGCTNTADWDITVDGCLGITDPNLSGDLLVYPNPTSGSITIEGLPAEGSVIKVIDLNGRQLISFECLSEMTEINLEALAPGQYMIEVINNEQMITKRIAKH